MSPLKAYRSVVPKRSCCYNDGLSAPEIVHTLERHVNTHLCVFDGL